MTNLALTYNRPLPAYPRWRPAEASATPRAAMAGAVHRLRTVFGATWAVLCGLLFGVAVVCVGSVACGALGLCLIARGVWAGCAPSHVAPARAGSRMRVSPAVEV